MTAKNFYTFNILIEFESICAFAQVLVAAKEFRFRGVVAMPGGSLSGNRALPRQN
jgi:hypothetical protein